MPGDLLTRAECPACGRPAALSRHLFQTRLLGIACSVQRCPCGLVYKSLAPQAGAIKTIYSEDYVHFRNAAITLGPADINSAKQKLARCRKLMPRNTPPGGWTLLDVGCGAGYFVSMARDLGYAAEGLDAFLPEGLEKEHLHRGSLEDLPPASYDIISLLNVAEHVVDPRPLFSGILRVLRPQGVLLLTCPYGASLACRFYRDGWVHMALDEHLLFWTPQALSCLLRPLGFKGPVSYRIAGSPFPYGRIAAAAASSENSGKGVSTASPSLQAKFWTLARWLQTQEQTANVVRNLVHWTKSGDYLEYAIQKNRAG